MSSREVCEKSVFVEIPDEKLRQVLPAGFNPFRVKLLEEELLEGSAGEPVNPT